MILATSSSRICPFSRRQTKTSFRSYEQTQCKLKQRQPLERTRRRHRQRFRLHLLHLWTPVQYLQCRSSELYQRTKATTDLSLRLCSAKPSHLRVAAPIRLRLYWSTSAPVRITSGGRRPVAHRISPSRQATHFNQAASSSKRLAYPLCTRLHRVLHLRSKLLGLALCTFQCLLTRAQLHLERPVGHHHGKDHTPSDLRKATLYLIFCQCTISAAVVFLMYLLRHPTTKIQDRKHCCACKDVEPALEDFHRSP